MIHHVYTFAVFVLTLAAIPVINDSFSRDTIVQSVTEVSHNAIVYDEALSEKWENWSWNSEIQFNSSESPYAGSRTINWKSHGWGGLYLHVRNDESLDPSQYEKLEFSLKGTHDSHEYTLVLYDENNQKIGNEQIINALGGTIPNGTWKKYSVLMNRINPDNKKIKGIVLQSKKETEQRLFVDEIKFIPNNSKLVSDPDSLTIYDDSLHTNWENWSWDSTVIMHETYKTNTGSRSIAFTVHRPWAALYLHAKQPVNTSEFTTLTFSLYASQEHQEFSLAVLDSHNSLIHSPKKLRDLGSPPKHNEWTTYTIPLTTLGANNTQISGLILQESKGNIQPIVYIDGISLKKSNSPITHSNSPTVTVTAIPTVQKVTESPTPNKVTSQKDNPFISRQLYINPNSNAKRTADEWRSQGRTTDADMLAKIYNNSSSMWAVGENSLTSISEYVTQANNANALPVIVSYNIPGRDCGQYSSGGTSYEGYKSWIQNMARTIGDRHAVVILEPDALGLDCLQNDTTYSLLRHAVETLESKPHVSVYIEAASWVNPDAIADRLRKSGIDTAQGFAINTSGYNTTDSMTKYGNTISSKVGKNFVIDTSRNGHGPYDQSQPEPWCNPPDRALGHRPTAHTGHSAVDAYLWIKVPGESDGTCRGGPSAGNWWPEYALGLSKRASY